MKISVCIISYKGSHRVPYLIRSILKNSVLKRDEYELILCDDGSDIKTQKYLSMFCGENDVQLIQHTENKGITRSWNAVVRASSCNNILLLNDDIIITPHALNAVYTFLQNDIVGCVGLPTFFMINSDMPKYFTNDGLVPRCPRTKRLLAYKEYEGQLKQQNNPPGACAVAVGCSFGFRKDRWEEIGGFDENVKSMYEDYIFNYEMLKRGYQNYQLRFPIIYHTLSGTFMGNPELEGMRLVVESERYFIKKYGGKITALADPLHNKQKKRIDVHFIDNQLTERYEACSV